jgi:hypothetical protein
LIFVAGYGTCRQDARRPERSRSAYAAILLASVTLASFIAAALVAAPAFARRCAQRFTSRPPRWARRPRLVPSYHNFFQGYSSAKGKIRQLSLANQDCRRSASGFILVYVAMRQTANKADIKITVSPVAKTSQSANTRRIGIS